MMIGKELNIHGWRAFTRNPMLGRNLAVRIFMFVVFGFLALEFLAFSFFLDKLLIEVGPYELAIHTFDSVVLYFFLGDFILKFLMKKNRSMQIAPYLTLPIPRNKLFSYLLRKEFASFWNWYPQFLVFIFALKAITPYFGVGTALLYIASFFLVCICGSLIVNLVNNRIDRSGWMLFVPVVVVAAIVGIGFIPGVDLMTVGMEIGSFGLDYPLVFLAGVIVVLGVLWKVNQKQMRAEVYREFDSSGNTNKASDVNISMFDRFGEIGMFMNLEIKLILRSKRLKQSLYVIVFFIAYFFMMLSLDGGNQVMNSPFMLLFFTIYVIGGMGMIMGQYVFTSESSYMDGLMARNKSLLPLLKAKYYLYSGVGFIATLILLLAVFYLQKISLLFLVSTFFFTIGVVFFIIFQCAVYNKGYFDLLAGNAFSWKGTNGNTLAITMIAMFIPLGAILIIRGLFGEDIANYAMLISGLLGTLLSSRWIVWTYKRFLKRKYKNMEGFRSA